VRQANKTN